MSLERRPIPRDRFDYAISIGDLMLLFSQAESDQRQAGPVVTVDAGG